MHNWVIYMLVSIGVNISFSRYLIPDKIAIGSRYVLQWIAVSVTILMYDYFYDFLKSKYVSKYTKFIVSQVNRTYFHRGKTSLRRGVVMEHNDSFEWQQPYKDDNDKDRPTEPTHRIWYLKLFGIGIILLVNLSPVLWWIWLSIEEVHYLYSIVRLCQLNLKQTTWIP